MNQKEFFLAPTPTPSTFILEMLYADTDRQKNTGTSGAGHLQYQQYILDHKSPRTSMLCIHLIGKDLRNIKSPLDEMNS